MRSVSTLWLSKTYGLKTRGEPPSVPSVMLTSRSAVASCNASLTTFSGTAPNSFWTASRVFGRARGKRCLEPLGGREKRRGEGKEDGARLKDLCQSSPVLFFPPSALLL